MSNRRTYPHVGAHAALNPGELIDLTRFVADGVRAGEFPQIRFDAESRWSQRILSDGLVDVWLISWLPTQGTQLHDHGGSAGAFTVVTGILTEAVVAGEGVTDLERPAGDSVGFGPEYVHDVRNTAAMPAVTVHAYSSPLTAMTYYDLAHGSLVPLARVLTDDPEDDSVLARVRSRAVA